MLIARFNNFINKIDNYVYLKRNVIKNEYEIEV